MSIVNNYDNAYLERQFTWIDIHRDCFLVIFNKSVKQAIGAL